VLCMVKKQSRQTLRRDIALRKSTAKNTFNRLLLDLRTQGIVRCMYEIKLADIDIVVNVLGMDALNNMSCKDFLNKLEQLDSTKHLIPNTHKQK
jgi:hypothetical protein